MEHPSTASPSSSAPGSPRGGVVPTGPERPRLVDLRGEIDVRDGVDLREDEVLVSLTALMAALRQSASRVEKAEQQAARTTRRRLDGMSLQEIVARAPRPLLIDMATFDLEAIATAGVRFRRAAARALQQEGMTVEEIAREFDVSHQRISRLLHADPDGPGPSWTSARGDRMRARDDALRASVPAPTRSVG